MIQTIGSKQSNNFLLVYRVSRSFAKMNNHDDDDDNNNKQKQTKQFELSMRTGGMI